jgi:hypothetical protein
VAAPRQVWKVVLLLAYKQQQQQQSAAADFGILTAK